MGAFWSYARHDALGYPSLFELRTYLQHRVGAKLGLRTDFRIWCDVEQTAGEVWNETISQELQAADVLIPILTPNWLASPQCRREFNEFCSHRAARGRTPLVAPIYLVRDNSFDSEGAGADEATGEVITRLRTFQYAKWFDIADSLEDAGLSSPAVKSRAREFAEGIAGRLKIDASGAPAIADPTPRQLDKLRRVPVPQTLSNPPKGPARLDIDANPNVMSTDRFLLRVDGVFRVVPMTTGTESFSVGLRRARLRVDVFGGVIDRDSIRLAHNAGPVSISFLGNQEWEIESANTKPLADNPLPDDGLCSVVTVADEAGASATVVVSEGDFTLTEADAAGEADPTCSDFGKRFGRNGRPLLKAFLRKIMAERLDRDDDDIKVCDASILTRLEDC